MTINQKEKALLTLLLEVMLPDTGYNAFTPTESGLMVSCNDEVIADLLSREGVYDNIIDGLHEILAEELEEAYGNQ